MGKQFMEGSITSQGTSFSCLSGQRRVFELQARPTARRLRLVYGDPWLDAGSGLSCHSSRPYANESRGCFSAYDRGVDMCASCTLLLYGFTRKLVCFISIMKFISNLRKRQPTNKFAPKVSTKSFSHLHASFVVFVFDRCVWISFFMFFLYRQFFVR